ncbi:hypothetical protein [Magnetofaba australis]|uniref:Uncharacterized protein n=1 Tax=Magnetofaba australis IT-1 TaxID=1434232 RepID=A0A1Y2JZH1_9PROT|nr:hypothetical protein [Magnetofaba australis]OSM00298.1 hypothetical protein MAIT1_00785 [Magnetofaba australis IT-1]
MGLRGWFFRLHAISRALWLTHGAVTLGFGVNLGRKLHAALTHDPISMPHVSPLPLDEILIGHGVAYGILCLFPLLYWLLAKRLFPLAVGVYGAYLALLLWGALA